MFKETLKQLRKKKRITQTQLGEYCGYSHVAVTKWENGQREPSIDTLVKIADFFDVTVDYLIGHDFDTKKQPNAITEHSSYVLTKYDKLLDDTRFLEIMKIYMGAPSEDAKSFLKGAFIQIAKNSGMDTVSLIGY